MHNELLSSRDGVLAAPRVGELSRSVCIRGGNQIHSYVHVLRVMRWQRGESFWAGSIKETVMWKAKKELLSKEQEITRTACVSMWVCVAAGATGAQALGREMRQ